MKIFIFSEDIQRKLVFKVYERSIVFYNFCRFFPICNGYTSWGKYIGRSQGFYLKISNIIFGSNYKYGDFVGSKFINTEGNFIIDSHYHYFVCCFSDSARGGST